MTERAPIPTDLVEGQLRKVEIRLPFVGFDKLVGTVVEVTTDWHKNLCVRVPGREDHWPLSKVYQWGDVVGQVSAMDLPCSWCNTTHRGEFCDTERRARGKRVRWSSRSVW